MDIPLVLEQLTPGKPWGPMSQTGKMYAEFSEYWPPESGTVPTEAAMEVKWAEIVAAQLPDKTDEELSADLDVELSGTGATKKVLKALMLDVLERDPEALARHGLTVKGKPKK